MHAYSQLFEGNVGQLIVSSNVRRSFVRAEALPPINLVIEPRFRRLRRPPRLCSTAVTYHVDHSHRLLVALDTVRGYPVSFGYEPFPADQLNPYMASESAKYADVIKKGNISLE